MLALQSLTTGSIGICHTPGHEFSKHINLYKINFKIQTLPNKKNEHIPFMYINNKLESLTNAL